MPFRVRPGFSYTISAFIPRSSLPLRCKKTCQAVEVAADAVLQI